MEKTTLPRRPLLTAFFLPALLVVLGVPLAPAMASSDGNADTAAEMTAFFSLDTMTVSIVRGGRVRGQLAVQVELEVTDRQHRIKVRRGQPRLRDAFLRTLVQYSNDRLDHRKPLDIQVIKHVLQRVTDRMFEPGQAEVLIGMAMIHPAKKRRR